MHPENQETSSRCCNRVKTAISILIIHSIIKSGSLCMIKLILRHINLHDNRSTKTLFVDLLIVLHIKYHIYI